jgi:hypothetical protein
MSNLYNSGVKFKKEFPINGYLTGLLSLSTRIILGYYCTRKKIKKLSRKNRPVKKLSKPFFPDFITKTAAGAHASLFFGHFNLKDEPNLSKYYV